MYLPTRFCFKVWGGIIGNIVWLHKRAMMSIWKGFLVIAIFTTAAFAEVRTERTDIFFVMDACKNMAEPGRFIKEGAHLAAYELNSRDKVAVLSFCAENKILLNFAGDPILIERALRKASSGLLRASGKCRLYDAIFTAIQEFPANSADKYYRAVAVITNEPDRGSTHQPQELIEAANSKNIALWFFLVGNPYAKPDLLDLYLRHRYPNVVQAEEQVRPLAAKTGGGTSVYDMNGYILRMAIAACKTNTK